MRFSFDQISGEGQLSVMYGPDFPLNFSQVSDYPNDPKDLMGIEELSRFDYKYVHYYVYFYLYLYLRTYLPIHLLE